MTEVERARASRAAFEPTWTVIWDDAYPPALHRPYWGAP
jgi:hypothetical protein